MVSRDGVLILLKIWSFITAGIDTLFSLTDDLAGIDTPFNCNCSYIFTLNSNKASTFLVVITMSQKRIRNQLAYTIFVALLIRVPTGSSSPPLNRVGEMIAHGWFFARLGPAHL